MKVFLTGITGFLGHHVAEALHRQGHEIHAFIRQPQKPDSIHIPFHAVQGTLSNCETLVPLLTQMDAVIHLAGKIKAHNLAEFNETNQQGTQNLIHALLKASPKPLTYVHVSTIAVMGPEIDGDDFCKRPELCHPVSWYGESKRRGEIEVQALSGKMRTVILRPPVLYGPHDKEMFALFQSIQKGFAPLFSEGKNQLSVCYIKDVADCIVSLIEKAPPQDEIYCLDDGHVHDWRSLSMDLAEVIGKKPRFISIPPILFKFGAYFSELYARWSGKAQIFTQNKIKEMEQKSWVCGYKRLSETRDWKPQYSFKEGAKMTYDFYRKNHWL